MGTLRSLGEGGCASAFAVRSRLRPTKVGGFRPTKRVERCHGRKAVGLHWGEEDQAYIAEAPELPGCAADGKTYKQALANVEVIIQEWIETATELNRPVPQSKGRLMYA